MELGKAREARDGGLYAFQGRKGEAALSFGGAIPVLGAAFTSVRYGQRAYRLLDRVSDLTSSLHDGDFVIGIARKSDLSEIYLAPSNTARLLDGSSAPGRLTAHFGAHTELATDVGVQAGEFYGFRFSTRGEFGFTSGLNPGRTNLPLDIQKQIRANLGFGE